jgi:uncharacterized protein YqgV (UPF0045/DUF77 family)
MLPIQTAGKHAYQWVDDVVEMIQQSGLAYTVTAFNTVVEGSFEQIHQLVNTINTQLVANHCTEWILQVQYQLRSDEPVTASEKLAKYTS